MQCEQIFEAGKWSMSQRLAVILTAMAKVPVYRYLLFVPETQGWKTASNHATKEYIESLPGVILFHTKFFVEESLVTIEGTYTMLPAGG